MAKEPTTIIADIQQIVDNGMQQACASANFAAIHTYWLVGRRIVEEEQNGSERATYGTNLINRLASELSLIYPKGYSARNLREYRQFYHISTIWRFGTRECQILRGHIAVCFYVFLTTTHGIGI